MAYATFKEAPKKEKQALYNIIINKVRMETIYLSHKFGMKFGA